MSKINTIQITDLMFGGFEEHDTKLSNAIDSNPEYMETVKKVESHYDELRKLDRELWAKMNSDVTRMEVAARDIAVDCHNEKGKFYQENKAKKKKNDIENFILTK